MKRLFVISSLLALCAASIMAGTTVIEGFENNTDPGGWQEVSSSPQTQNATNNTVPTYVSTNVTEGLLAGQFTHNWTLPGTAATSNPYISTDPLLFWSMRINTANPGVFGSIPHTAIIRADVFNSNAYPIDFSLCLYDDGGTGGLERGPFQTLAPGVSTTYSWDLSSGGATSFYTGNGVLDGSSSVLRGAFLYTTTAPTVVANDITIDNIRLETTQTDFDAPEPPVVLSAVQGASSDEIIVRWLPNTESDLDHYNVYLGTDDDFGSTIQNRFTFPSTPAAQVAAGTNQVTLNVSPEANAYVRVTAVDNATPSPNASLSRVALGVRTGTGAARDLVVLDNDAIEPSSASYAINGYSHNIAYNAHALIDNSRFFDSCTANAVSLDAVALTSVNASSFIIWSNGLDGGSGFGGVSVDPANITRLTTYLNAGGKLFISGRSIGEDLENNGSAADQAFYADELLADLITPQTQTFEINFSGLFGSAGTAYTGDDAFNYAAGSTNSSESMDAISPAQEAGAYNPAPTSGGSPIVYNNHQTILMGVDFEILRPVEDSSATFAQARATRAALMGDVIDYLFPGPTTPVVNFELYR